MRSERKLRVLSLFAGIGGFDLGLERTGGFETVAFCEIDPFCQRVLHKHWPKVPYYHDVRELTAEWLVSDGINVDCIVGGFPCQGVSIAGKGAGLSDARSGLWTDYARLIGEIGPSSVVIENSPKLRSRGLLTVLTDLYALGYNAEWHCIPAAHVGAPHRRDRIWILAYRQEDALGPDTYGIRPYSPSMHLYREAELRDEQVSNFGQMAWWRSEPKLERVVDGNPTKLDIARLKCVGNAVTPQIPELIGQAILASMTTRRIAARQGRDGNRLGSREPDYAPENTAQQSGETT